MLFDNLDVALNILESHANSLLKSCSSLQPIQGPRVNAGRNLEEKCGGERGEDRLPRVTAEWVGQQEQGTAEAFDGGKMHVSRCLKSG